MINDASTLRLPLVLGLAALALAAFGTGSARAGCGEEGNDDIAFQGSGKLLLGACGKKQAAVIRLDRSGRLDPTFAEDGSLGPWTSNFPAHPAVTPEGKVLVQMTLGKGKGRRVVLRRFFANGKLDRSFAGGNAPVPTGGSVPEEIHVFGQPQGTAVVAYYGENDGCWGNDCAERTNYLQLYRYSATGKRIAEASHYTEYWNLTNVTMAPNGDILAAGNDLEYGTVTFLRTKPTLKTRAARKTGEEFGSGPQEILPGAGTSVLISGNEAGVGRYRSDWSLVESFGDRGFVDCGSSGERSLRLLASLPSGAFLAEGDSTRCPLMRYQADGRPDPGFGSGGSVDLAGLGLVPPRYRLESIAVGPEGQFAIAFANEDKPIVRISRFTADGHLETGFGKGGVVTIRNFRPA